MALIHAELYQSEDLARIDFAGYIRKLVALRPDNNKLTLTISDNGVGFPKDLDFRNTKTLGLQLVVTLTNQLDGTIELGGSGGRTTFNITFAKL